MRRGWILLLTLVVLLLGGGFAWWWSTPGQLWWLQYKADRDIPPLLDSPGGLDPWRAEEAAKDFLEPQVSRLIARDYVRWYARRIPARPTDEQFRRLRSRFEREILLPPHPLPWIFDRRMIEPWKDGGDTLVILLLPPDQHAVLARLCREELGTEGEPIAVGNITVLPLNLMPNLKLMP